MARRAFIAWVKHDRRPELLAARLGASMHFIQAGRRHRLAEIPARYTAQARMTWNVLWRERPEVVFVQNPPIFCVMVAAYYARLTGARYVIDSHTGSFLSPQWRWSLPLLRRLSAGALTTIVHNKDQAEVLKNWGLPHLVLGYVTGEYPKGEPVPMPDGFNVAVICGQMGGDEPMEVIFEAARRLPDVWFNVTGDTRYLAHSLRSQVPPNMHLTGYLPYQQYIGLLRSSGGIAVLTSWQHGLLMGGFEAVALEVPLLVSDSPLLREFFSQGTVYVPNTPEGFAAGVRRMQQQQEILRSGICRLRERLECEMTSQIAALESILAAPRDMSRASLAPAQTGC